MPMMMMTLRPEQSSPRPAASTIDVKEMMRRKDLLLPAA